MRVTSADVPRRPLGLRGWLIGAAIALLLLILSMRGLARFYTDYLWFDEVGFGDTWRRLLTAKAVPALIFSSAFFVLLLANLIVADRVAPRFRSSAGPEDEIIERYRTYVAPYSGRLRVLVALFFALVMGGGVSAEWRSWILFSNAVDFGVEDPQFHRDIGFYVFRLPFLQFAVGWTFAALLVVLIVTAVFHYLNGGIRLQSPWQRVTPQVKVHLSVILALMALTKTAQYYLARYELTFSRRGFVDGASYTDVKAQLPALNLLMIISVAAAALFIANIFRRGWVFPVIAVGLWGFISLVVGTIYPAVIQRVVVQPNEFSREEPYLRRNIDATRAAFNLGDDSVSVREFDYQENLEVLDVQANTASLNNARLWGPTELQRVFRATQEIRTEYRFGDVDVDRYRIGADDELPALIAPRELDEPNIPDRTWTNRHLRYTHGCGAVVAAGNAEQNGEPSYLLANLDPITGELSPGFEEPRIYFGEGLRGYVIVDTKLDEQSCVEGAEPRYDGQAGVRSSSLLRRVALGLRFWDWNIVVSGQLTGDSRALYMRDIRERVTTAAPFLRFDSDPYSVVLNGRTLWIIDGYTTSNRYPYSQFLHPSNLPPGSGLDTEFNYVRNSVKATVDAYDGTVRLYIVDEEDPIIRAYAKAFPKLFSDMGEMPEGLRDHWRYPEDLFRAQTEQYTQYHMTDAREFFGKVTLWDIAPRPEGSATSGGASTATTAAGDTTLAANRSPIDPLYITTQLPDEDRQEFVLTRPFVPRGKQNQLAAFMYARTDGDDYGKMVVYQLPDNRVAPSPTRAASLIESEQRISAQFTLLDRAGSNISRGSIQMLAVADSVVYIRPIYVASSAEGSFPRLRFVAVAYGEDAVLADLDPDRRDVDVLASLPEAITALVTGDIPDAPIDPEDPDAPEEPDEPEPEEPEEPEEPAEPEEPPADATVASLLARAIEEFAAADAELRAGNLAGFDQHVAAAEALVLQAQALAAGTPPETTTTTTVVNA
ncbi:MAG: UPF0182 family membrane protein [Actinomycetota bacterium]